MNPIAIFVIVALVALILFPFAWESLLDRKARREATARMHARYPMLRELPLSPDDKRGWVIDQDGVPPR
ncbi:hypothetical protein [Burkholderia multivorans]|uniref:hypothetical protein n=1 Tax=Burkholderia multivorans TaxID=87883 RepID=UPI00057CF775|nr:hypothetical protein [Burkholderia multivorans]KHS09412.1 hypothetical protein BMD20_29505 [Burkholderia multivorans]KHS10392.1 hypothetical protein BMD22_28325 [Burkholderia multivorans]MDR9230029.1 hypothetical protein [Burkholderia multivorans]HDR9474393.1 hypothetical protein [Burkholderia multivorans]HDR9480235.1 hypothetical protein [Burkholderia multivorans]